MRDGVASGLEPGGLAYLLKVHEWKLLLHQGYLFYPCLHTMRDSDAFALDYGPPNEGHEVEFSLDSK